MTTIGMLHHRKDPETVLKSYAFAAVAKAEGVTFFYFSPRTVNFTTRKIQGKVLEDGVWQDRTMPFPDVIYNAGSPEKLAVSRNIIQKLKKKFRLQLIQLEISGTLRNGYSRQRNLLPI